MRRSDKSSELNGGVFNPALSETNTRRSFPGVVPIAALVGAFSLVNRVSVGSRPAVSIRVSQ